MLTVKNSIKPVTINFRSVVNNSFSTGKNLIIMKKILFVSLVLLLFIPVSFSQTSGKCAFTASDNTRHYPDTQGDNINRTVDCDTLRYPLSGEIIYYYMLPPGVGYITGNNSYMDKAKAEYFSDFEAGTSISGLFVDFVIAKNANNPEITFAIWNNAGANGKPGQMVVSATKPLWAIAADVTNEHATKVNFDQPYTVTGPFYAGVILPSSTGDTLAIWCRKHVTGYNGTAWEQWSTNAWYPFNDPDSWGENMQTTMTIHPIVCQPVGLEEVADPEVTIHPNPATGVVNISLWKSTSGISLKIINMTGQRVYTRSYPASFTNFNIDLSFIPKGVYMLQLTDGKRKHSQKLILR